MTNFQLPKTMSESIVDGIIYGYKDYVNVRREKAGELKVHGAYAWVKGNHIDHHVAVECEKHGVTCRLAKAGLTWQYLQFQHDEDKILFIIKNARYFDPNAVDKGKDVKGNTRKRKATYITNLVDINSSIKFPKESDSITQSTQLQLFEYPQFVSFDEEDTKELNKEYDRFYIVTYSIDPGFQINSIKVWMPNPVNNKAYSVEDLSQYINKKPSHFIEIEEETKTILQSTAEIERDYSDYGIIFDVVEDEEKEG